MCVCACACVIEMELCVYVCDVDGDEVVCTCVMSTEMKLCSVASLSVTLHEALLHGCLPCRDACWCVSQTGGGGGTSESSLSNLSELSADLSAKVQGV